MSEQTVKEGRGRIERVHPDCRNFVATVAAIGRVAAEAGRIAFERQIQETQRLESLGVLAGGIAYDAEQRERHPPA